MTTTKTDHDPTAHDWREAGAAWGHAAVDWACLYEHYSVDVLAAMCAATGVARASTCSTWRAARATACASCAGCGATVAGHRRGGGTCSPSPASATQTPTSASARCSNCRGPTRRSTSPCPSTASGVAATHALVEMRRVLRPGGRVGDQLLGRRQRRRAARHATLLRGATRRTSRRTTSTGCA